MHASLDSALGRQRRLNSVGESVLQIAPNAAAAYSLRSLTGGDPTVVRVRRGSDNHEQDFTASEVSAGALTSFVNAQVVAPLDIQELEADGRTGDFLIAKAAYSLRSLGTRQATVAATGDTVARADGKYVAQVRRNVNGDVKSFTADEVTDGTLTSFVNESFTSSLPLDVAGSAAAAYGLRNLSSSYSGNVVEVRRSSDDTTQNFTAAEITDGTLVSFVTESFQKTLSVQALSEDSTWDVTVVDNSNYTIDCNNNTSTKFCRLISSNLPAGTKYRAEFTFTTNSGDASNLKLNRSSPFLLQNIVEGSNSIEFDFTADTVLQFRVAAGSNVFNATISNLTVTAIGNDGHVKTWYDQSGNSNDATQATAANQPKIVSAGVLESDGIHFDGSDDVLTASGTYSRSGADLPLSMLSVFKQDVEGVQYVTSISRGAAGNPFNRHLLRTNLFEYARRDDSGASKVAQAIDPDINTKYLFSSFDSGTTASGFVNGSSAFSNVDVDLGTQTINQIDIGAYNSSSVLFPFNGKIQEFILYDTDQSDKRRAIEESIATANGITLDSFSRDGFVKTWYDQSVTNEAGDTATGNHATQATAASQPKIVSAGSLNADGIKFDGTDDELTTSSFISGSNFSAFSVLKCTDISSNENQAWNFTDTSSEFYGFTFNRNSSGNVAFASTTPDKDLGESSYTGNKKLFSTFSGTSNSYYSNGTESVLVKLGRHSPSTGNTIGSQGTGGRYLEGSIEELIVYTSDQSDNRTALEANIGETYSIDLPSGVDPGFDQVDGFVETWYDQSGNSNDATQATAGSQPKIVDGGSLVTEGSLPTIDFDGTDDFFAASGFAFSPAGDFLSLVVSKVSTGQLFDTRDGASDGLFVQQGGSAFRYRYNGDGSIDVSGNNEHTLSTLELNGTTLTAYKNGTSGGTDTVTAGLSTTTAITISKTSFNSSNFINGNIQEIILYDTDQSANRPAIEANINSQYSIF